MQIVIDPDPKRKRRGPKSLIGRARGARFPADIHIKTYRRDGLIKTDVVIPPAYLDRLASGGQVPTVHVDTLKSHAESLIADIENILHEMSVQRTRRQLRHELVELHKLAQGGVVPVMSESLRTEIEAIAIKQRLNLPIGRPGPPIAYEEIEAVGRKGDAARAEALSAFEDAQALVALIERVLDYMRARDLAADPKRPDRMTREFYKEKSAQRIELDIVFPWISHFWQHILGRPLVRSDELTLFTIEALKMCGVSIAGLSLERRLQALVREAGGRKD